MDKQKTIDITGRLGQPSPSGRATAQHARSEGTHYGKDRLGISTDLDVPAQTDSTAPRSALQAYTPDMCPADAQRRTVPTGEQVDKQSDLAAVPSRPAAGRKRIVVLVVAGVVALAAAWGLWSWLGGSSSTPQRAGATPAPPAIPTTPVTPKPPQAVRPAPPVVPPAPKLPAPVEAGASRLTSPPRPAPRRAKAWLAPSRRPKAAAPPSEVVTPTRPAPGEAPAPRPDEKQAKPAKRFRAPPAGITLGGVASFGDQRFADINGKLLTIGDTINGATLVKIGDMHVEMEIEGEYFQVEVGGASTPNGQEGKDSPDKTSDE